MKTLSKLVNKIRKHPLIDTVFVAFGLVLIWRGTWGILDLIFPVNDAKWYLFTIFVGIFILWLDDFRIDEVKNR